MSERPKYMFCWWCRRQLWGKRIHTAMHATGANENASPVFVHRECANDMERDGGWARVANENAA